MAFSPLKTTVEDQLGNFKGVCSQESNVILQYMKYVHQPYAGFFMLSARNTKSIV